MSNDLAVPDYLKEFIDDAEIARATDMVSSAGSVPRISLKGKKFRLNKDGEEVAKYSDEMIVIIIGIQPDKGLAKTYYKDKYDPESSAPPDCSSTNGMVPDSWVTNPVSKVCADCPMNKWGSGVAMTKGKQAKACRESKILWVIDPREKVEKGEERTLYGFNVTVSSLKALTTYAKELAGHGVPTPAAVLTTIVMDDDSEYPQVTFKLKAFLKESQGRMLIERSKKREWDTDEHRAAITNQSVDPQKQITKDEPKAEEVKNETAEISDDDVDDIMNTW